MALYPVDMRSIKMWSVFSMLEALSHHWYSEAHYVLGTFAILVRLFVL